MQMRVPRSTSLAGGPDRPLRCAPSSYGFMPKRGGSSTTTMVARSFPFVSGPVHGHGRDCSGTFRSVSGPARFRNHTASSPMHGGAHLAAVHTRPAEDTNRRRRAGLQPEAVRMPSRVRPAVFQSYGFMRSNPRGRGWASSFDGQKECTAATGRARRQALRCNVSDPARRLHSYGFIGSNPRGRGAAPFFWKS